MRIDGSATIEEAASVREHLLEALGQGERLSINLETLGDADLSFLQLLCATHREALSQGKEVVLVGISGDRLAGLLERAGYVRQSGCLPEARESCLWMKVKSQDEGGASDEQDHIDG